MAIYRFKISFEDYDDVVREIDIRPSQTFEDLHQAIHRSTGYNAEKSSSFYVSNDQWIKNEEIAYLPNQRKVDKGVKLMSKAKLSAFIDDPHQKFYYIYDFDKPLDFHVELIKILLNDEVGKEYPCVVRSLGEAPKILESTILPAATSNDLIGEFDFLNEIDFDPKDAEEIENMNEMGINTEDKEEDEHDDMMDEFSDHDEYDADDSHKDDY